MDFDERCALDSVVLDLQKKAFMHLNTRNASIGVQFLQIVNTINEQFDTSYEADSYTIQHVPYDEIYHFSGPMKRGMEKPWEK